MMRTTIIRLLSVLGATLLLSSLVFASSVAFAEEPTTTITPAAGPAGTKITVVGTNAAGLAQLAQYGLAVVIQYDGKEVVNQKVAAGTTRGEWSFQATGDPGAHKVEVGYNDPTSSKFVASSALTFTVTAASAQPLATTTQLPSSGDSVPAAALLGLGFAALGSGLAIRRLAPASP